MHTGSPDYASTMIEKGFDLVTVSSDHRLMVANAQATLKAVKGGT